MNPPMIPSAAVHAPVQEPVDHAETAAPAAAVGLTRTGSILQVRLNPSAQDDDVLSSTVLDALIAVLDGLHEQPDIHIVQARDPHADVLAELLAQR